MMIEWDLVVVPHARIAARVVAGQALILDPKNDALQRLNDVGSFVWTKIADRAYTLNEIEGHLVDEFDADRETIRFDLQRFAEELVTRECISFLNPSQ